MIIGITGGSGSGKTTLAQMLQQAIGSSKCSVLSQDHYYIDQSHRFTGDGETVNFDHPDALDWPLFVQHLEQLRSAQQADIPIYDFATHKRLAETMAFSPSSVVLVDGTLILSRAELRPLLNKSLFVQTSEEIRFMRRLARDVEQRGRTPEGVRKQFLNHVKPMHDLFVEPSRQHADVILSGESTFDVQSILKRVIPTLLMIPLLFFSHAHAVVQDLPTSLPQQVLSETIATAHTVLPISGADFSVEWSAQAISGVSLFVAEQSLEWVRVSDVLVIPRGRLMVEIQGADSALVSHAGFTQSFAALEGGRYRAEIPIALIAGERNPIFLTVRRGGQTLKQELRVRYRPKSQDAGRVYYDSSCSPFGVEAEDLKLKPETGVYVGCRVARVATDNGAAPSLEILVFWNQHPSVVRIDQIEQQPLLSSVWAMRLRSQPGVVRFTSGGDDGFSLRYRIGQRFRHAFIGAGLGPYHYAFQDGELGKNVKTVAPILTLYGSYFFSETVRAVTFNATAIHSSFFSDQGVYLMIEQFRAYDQRFSFNLLLGAHAIAFGREKNVYARMSAPQGIEMVLRDSVLRYYNLSLGGFVYPPISGKSYYNLWLRWGTRSLFGEINYIAWREPFGTETVSMSSLGVSLGIPIAQFL